MEAMLPAPGTISTASAGPDAQLQENKHTTNYAGLSE